MNALSLDPTKDSPGVLLDHVNLRFRIWGESRPEHAKAFFDPVLDWLQQFRSYLRHNEQGQGKSVQFDFALEYFNSSSAEYILDIIDALAGLRVLHPEANVHIHWHYEEEDLLEAGEELANVTGMSFTFIKTLEKEMLLTEETV